jgi:hypothetical protein
MTSISVAAEECAAFGHRRQVVESFPGRDTNLGDLKILRALPIKGSRSPVGLGRAMGVRRG